MAIKTVPIITLFTRAEHVILADWLGLEPAPEAEELYVHDALSELGFTREPGFYSIEAAAVAYILLESVEARLPQWAAVYFSPKKGTRVQFARPYRDPDGKPLRKISLVSRKLFAINWADSGPGYSWPIEYRLVWVPYYERWVVTASADSSDAFGYCDFALGSFTRDERIKEAIGEIIIGDWKGQFVEHNQNRWAFLFDNDFISEDMAERWADEVWASDEGREDDE